MQSFQQFQPETEEPLDPNMINELSSIPLYKTTTNQSVRSTASDFYNGPGFFPFNLGLYQEELSQKIWRAVRIAIWIFSWWLGAGGLFAYFESWSYFDGIYFAFVSMTGIGYGDFTVHSAVGIEIWWIFLFNAVLLILT